MLANPGFQPCWVPKQEIFDKPHSYCLTPSPSRPQVTYCGQSVPFLAKVQDVHCQVHPAENSALYKCHSRSAGIINNWIIHDSFKIIRLSKRYKNGILNGYVSY